VPTTPAIAMNALVLIVAVAIVISTGAAASECTQQQLVDGCYEFCVGNRYCRDSFFLDYYRDDRRSFGRLMNRFFDNHAALYNSSLRQLLIDEAGYCDEAHSRMLLHLLISQHHFCPHQNMIFIVGGTTAGDCQCADGKHCVEHDLVCESTAVGILKIILMSILAILIIVWLKNKYARRH
jgi:hypothetical protein